MKSKSLKPILASLTVVALVTVSACSSSSDSAQDGGETTGGTATAESITGESAGDSEADTVSAKESEGETSVGAMGRAQQAFHLENGTFAKTVEELQVGVPEETDSYQYSVEASDDEAVILGQAKEDNLRSYKAIVSMNSEGEGLATKRVVCVTGKPGMEAVEADRNVENPDEPCQ
ncbi:MAG: type IV pilin-like G/H family protein [Cyanobacteria bacterium P01_C01_bin.89]